VGVVDGGQQRVARHGHVDVLEDFADGVDLLGAVAGGVEEELVEDAHVQVDLLHVFQEAVAVRKAGGYDLGVGREVVDQVAAGAAVQFYVFGIGLELLVFEREQLGRLAEDQVVVILRRVVQQQLELVRLVCQPRFLFTYTRFHFGL